MKQFSLDYTTTLLIVTELTEAQRKRLVRAAELESAPITKIGYLQFSIKGSVDGAVEWIRRKTDREVQIAVCTLAK